MSFVFFSQSSKKPGHQKQANYRPRKDWMRSVRDREVQSGQSAVPIFFEEPGDGQGENENQTGSVVTYYLP